MGELLWLGYLIGVALCACFARTDDDWKNFCIGYGAGCVVVMVFFNVATATNYMHTLLP